MKLSINYPFNVITGVMLDVIEKIQGIGGVVTIHSHTFTDQNQIRIAQKWIIRMLTAHYSDVRAKSIFNGLSWSEKE